MDWLAEMEDERRLLKRVVAAFYLLAFIAGLSCVMPKGARSYVLSVLRRLEAVAIEIVSGRARDRGLELRLPEYQISDALIGGDSRADALRFARTFRALAALLRQVIDHYPCRQHDGDTAQFDIGYHRPGNLLAMLCRLLADMTGRQMRQASMRVAFEPIDSP